MFGSKKSEDNFDGKKEKVKKNKNKFKIDKLFAYTALNSLHLF